MNSNNYSNTSEVISTSDAVGYTLQHYLTMLSNYQKQISEAKTSVKKSFYKKKIDKLKPDVYRLMQLQTVMSNQEKTDVDVEDGSEG